MNRLSIVSCLCAVFFLGCFDKTPFIDPIKDSCIGSIDVLVYYSSALKQDEQIEFEDSAGNISLRISKTLNERRIAFDYYFWKYRTNLVSTSFFKFGEYVPLISTHLQMEDDQEKHEYSIIGHYQNFRKRYSHVIAIKKSQLLTMLRKKSPFYSEEEKKTNSIYVLNINPLDTDPDEPINWRILNNIVQFNDDFNVSLQGFIEIFKRHIIEKMDSSYTVEMLLGLTNKKERMTDDEIANKVLIRAEELDTQFSEMNDNLIERIIYISPHMITKDGLLRKIFDGNNYIRLNRKE